MKFTFFAVFTLALLADLAAARPTPSSQPAPQSQSTTVEKDALPPAATLANPDTVFAATTPTVVTDALKFAEGPLWHDGKLFVCDLSGDAVYTISRRRHDVPTTDTQLWNAPVEFRKPSGRAAGSAVDAQGRLLLAAFTGTVTRTEQDGTVSTIAKETVVNGGAQPLARCNDLAVHPDGTIFFTDFGKKGSESKGLFCIRPDGTVAALDADYAGANGVALSPDARTLYVNDYGKNLVIAYDCGAKGGVSNRRVFADLSAVKADGRCDGLKVHPLGRVFTTGPGGIWVIAADGKPVTRLDIEGGASNLCFGGDDGRTVFITSGNQVLSVELTPVLAPTAAPEKR